MNQIGVFGGDSNVVHYNYEKFPHGRMMRSTRKFDEFITETELRDVDLVGAKSHGLTLDKR